MHLNTPAHSLGAKHAENDNKTTAVWLLYGCIIKAKVSFPLSYILAAPTPCVIMCIYTATLSASTITNYFRFPLIYMPQHTLSRCGTNDHHYVRWISLHFFMRPKLILGEQFRRGLLILLKASISIQPRQVCATYILDYSLHWIANNPFRETRVQIMPPLPNSKRWKGKCVEMVACEMLCARKLKSEGESLSCRGAERERAHAYIMNLWIPRCVDSV